MNLTFQLIDPAGRPSSPGPHPVPRGGVRRPHPPGSLAIRELAPPPGGPSPPPPRGRGAGGGGRRLRRGGPPPGRLRLRRGPGDPPGAQGAGGDGWPEALPCPGQSPHRPGHPGLPPPQVQPGEGGAGDRLLFPRGGVGAAKGGALPRRPPWPPPLQALAQETERPAAGLLVWDFRAQSLETALWTAQDAALTHPRRCAAGGQRPPGEALRGREGRQTLAPPASPGGA